MKRLICFAVSDEKRFFQPAPDDKVLVTGMGARAAEAALRKSLKDNRPELIVAAGFAGGLNPQLTLGQVVLDDRQGAAAARINARKDSALIVTGIIFSSARVLITPEEKGKCRSETHADAVDMESETIRRIAGEQGIPMIALRSISDTVHEMLPLDFNQFMTPQGGMRFGRLIAHLMFHPGKIPSLLRFQKRVSIAARELAKALEMVNGELGG
jgi:adenosylhomocysteine nucleosidase